VSVVGANSSSRVRNQQKKGKKGKTSDFPIPKQRSYLSHSGAKASTVRPCGPSCPCDLGVRLEYCTTSLEHLFPFPFPLYFCASQYPTNRQSPQCGPSTARDFSINRRHSTLIKIKIIREPCQIRRRLEETGIIF
jgi:hypothetical protein